MAPVKKPPHKLGRQYLREWRLSKRPELTQAKVADALDIDQSVISRLETGKTPYEQIMLERLAKLYGCEPADLIHGPPGRINTGRVGLIAPPPRWHFLTPSARH